VDLLENAIESIRVGVEDYAIGSAARLLSAARNIHAGILLLFKEALHRRSPPNSNDALIMSKIMPQQDSNGKIIFVGIGRNTVTAGEVKDRFKSLSIHADWVRFQKINRARNEIEHFYPKLTQQALQGLIADSFLIVREFVRTELKEDPRDLLGEETWQAMLQVTEVYEAERKHCEELLDQVNWESPALLEGLKELSCPECGSQLLRPKDVVKSYQDVLLVCSSCGATETISSFAPRAIETALQDEAYLAIKDGGETPYVDCPVCGEEAYVVEENRCASCGESVETTCIRCGNDIPPVELESSPMCGWCAHMSSKDD
jgi:DNA-directed RNA polymerase subunit M/transcription elongation factor TFIIS